MKCRTPKLFSHGDVINQLASNRSATSDTENSIKEKDHVASF